MLPGDRVIGIDNQEQTMTRQTEKDIDKKNRPVEPLLQGKWS